MVVGGVVGIDVECHGMARANRIEPNATLEASTGTTAELPLHLMLGNKLRWVHGARAETG